MVLALAAIPRNGSRMGHYVDFGHRAADLDAEGAHGQAHREPDSIFAQDAGNPAQGAGNPREVRQGSARAAQEMQKVYKDAGVRPMAGCLPVLVQIPMFIGLFHVLRSFDRTVSVAGGFGHPSGEPMSIEDNANTANYIFKPELVQQFLDAKIFGVPLVTNLRLNSPLVEGVTTTTQAAFIIVPMIAVIVVLMHFNARMSLNRQEKRRAQGKTSAPQGQNAEMMQQQMAMMSKMMLWVMPAMLIFSGFIWPIGLLFYMLSNTVWTFFQTRIIYGKMDREEEEEEAAKIEAKRTTAPKPGARKKDNRTKKQRKNDN